MKENIRQFFFSPFAALPLAAGLFFLGALFAHAQTQDDRTTPTVFTQSAILLAQTSVELQGTVNPNGAKTDVWFEFGETSLLGQIVGHRPLEAGRFFSPFAFTVGGLQPGTTYFYRAVGQNAFGVSQGSILNFTTLQGSSGGSSGLSQGSRRLPPVVTTNAVSGTSAGTIAFNGTVNPNGSQTIAWFEYGPTPLLGRLAGSQSVGRGESGINYSFTISRPSLEGVYYYRAVSQNDFGTAFGGIVTTTVVGSSFEQGSAGTLPPFAISRSPALVADTTALLSGAANPRGSNTNAWFEWGETAFLGRQTPTQIIGNGNDAFNYSYLLTGLQPSTRYFYRAAAQNSAGVGRDTAVSFTTALRSTTTPVVFPLAPAPPQPAPAATRLPAGGRVSGGVLISASGSIVLTSLADTLDPRAGDEFGFTVVYRNQGGVPVRDAILTVTLPAGVEFRSANVLPTSQSLDEISFFVGEIIPQSQGAIALRLRLKDTVPDESTLVLKAVLAFRDPAGREGSADTFSALSSRTGAGFLVRPGGGAPWWLVVLLAILSAGLLLLLFFIIKKQREKEETQA
ncbi:MAG: fibronectin type III domain-containing protein [Candidatus Sungbacteria bacterium]|nr:fibronectin type III domain-containing protein [Candidatus Sungbacteria bacterium]